MAITRVEELESRLRRAARRQTLLAVLMGAAVLVPVLALLALYNVGLEVLIARDVDGALRRVGIATVQEVFPYDTREYVDRSAWYSVPKRGSSAHGKPPSLVAVRLEDGARARLYSRTPVRVGQKVRVTYRVGRRSGVVYPDSVAPVEGL